MFSFFYVLIGGALSTFIMFGVGARFYVMCCCILFLYFVNVSRMSFDLTARQIYLRV